MKTTESKGHPDIIELKIPAKDKNVAIVRLCVSGIGAQMEFTVDEIEDIKMAVGEACINAIYHGYENKGNPEDIVSFRFTMYPTKLAITVKDNGKGFDTKQIEKYIQQDEKKSLKKSGLGLFLMKSLMDELELDSNPSGTQVRMVKAKRAL